MTCFNSNLTIIPPNVQQSSYMREMRVLIIVFNNLILSQNIFQGQHWLGKLNITYNNISSLPNGVFRDLHNLRVLDLSHNNLRALSAGVFSSLRSLAFLNLSHNHMISLGAESFTGLNALQRLDITHNEISYLNQYTFKHLRTLRMLNTDAFKFCCVANHVPVCTPEADEFSSCADLLANPALQIAIWVLGALAFLGNLFVIGWRVKTEKLRVSSLLILNLGVSDLLMGIYLLIIGAVDWYYRGVYIVHADTWRASALCKTSGFLAMFSSEVSVFTMTVITMDRVVSIIFTFKLPQLRVKHARNVLIVGWIVCFVFSVLPATGLEYFGDEFYGRTGDCLIIIWYFTPTISRSNFPVIF